MGRKLNLRLHPIQVLRRVREHHGTKLELCFSKYYYTPSTRRDERHSFRVGIADVDGRWLHKQLQELAPHEELALESRVYVEGVSSRLHIPMVDFYGLTKGQLAAVMEVLPEYR